MLVFNGNKEMIDFYNYDLEKEIEKIKNTKNNPNDLDYYSYRKIVHQIYNIPEKYNIEAYVYHGINIADNELKDYALDVNYPVLAIRQSQVDYLLKKGGIENNIFASGSLFTRYRNFKNIKPAGDAKGTVVFPYHSCSVADAINDFDKYIEDLKKLPDEFKPINICMYWIDILKNRHQIFLNNGFNVYTAGHCNDPDFVDNFYEILKHHKYATANSWSGSNLLYCVEFGIPTFVYCDETYLEQKLDEKFLEKTGIENLDVFKKYGEISHSFFKKHFPKYPETKMSEESKREVLIKLGMDYQTPDKKIRQSILKHIHKKHKKEFINKLKKFIYKKEKIKETRLVTIFGVIKFKYAK